MPGFVIQGGDGEFGRVAPTGSWPSPSSPGPAALATRSRTSRSARTTTAASWRWPGRPIRIRSGSQFFIVLDDRATEALAYYNTYAIVGKVTAGMDVVDTIAAMPNAGEQAGNAALEPVPMTKVTVSQ